MNKYFRLVFYIFISSVFMMGCRQSENGTREEKDDPLPVLQSMKIH